MRPAAPAVTAVILNHNGFDDTVACVDSLARAGYAHLPLVIVDNASPDSSGEALRARFPQHTVLLHHANDGFAAGMNEGIRRALDDGAEFVLVMNNDIVVEAGFLDGMVAHLASHPRTGIATCKAYLSSDPSRRYMTGGHLSLPRCNVAPLTEAEAETAMRVPFISGCIFLARAAVFRECGLMDESFFLYFEDLEFSRRVATRWELWYLPDGVIHHKSGGGTGWSAYTSTYHYYMNRNRFLVFRGDGLARRAYVLLYSTLNTIAKSAVILASSRNGDESRDKLRALWRGLRDGAALFFSPSRRATPDRSSR
ncbi:MAG: glycosyltransferase family 2 protein [Ignavibacteria bacterium]|nr:glycosyltransferase family 2 protein [Ignavibacteria bacterium]